MTRTPRNIKKMFKKNILKYKDHDFSLFIYKKLSFDIEFKHKKIILHKKTNEAN